MKVTKCYCDMCGKEIERPVDISIPIKSIVGKHGIHETQIRIYDESYGGSYMDLCDDCKKFIASSFEFRRDVTKLKEELNKIMEEGKSNE